MEMQQGTLTSVHSAHMEIEIEGVLGVIVLMLMLVRVVLVRVAKQIGGMAGLNQTQKAILPKD